jgi:hypothetical protein
MNAIKLARQDYDCREVIAAALGEDNRHDMYHCPFHADSTPSFKVYKEGFYCYGCGQHGDIFDWLSFWQKRPLADVLRENKINPEEEAARKRAYLEREVNYIRERLEKAEAGIKSLQEEQLHLKYYESGGTTGKEAWEARGVPDWYQDFTYLGYDPDHSFWIGEEYHTPTLTIPVYEPGTRDLVNIRHRLLNPCDQIGKYRPERSGLPASLFTANPDQGLTGKTVLCEGEIKSMITWITADNGLQVVGTPSKNLSAEMFKKLQECDPIYYVPDPDVDRETILKVAKEFKGHDFFYVRLPGKIDDMILESHLGSAWVNGVLKSARRITI